MYFTRSTPWTKLGSMGSHSSAPRGASILGNLDTDDKWNRFALHTSSQGKDILYTTIHGFLVSKSVVTYIEFLNSTYFQCSVYRPLLHICTRQVKDSVNTTVVLSKTSQVQTAIFCGTACTPCDANCKWVQCREARNTGEEILKALHCSISARLPLVNKTA
jgi:hypothetical protein